MEHFLYIIYSRSKDSYYVGESRDVNERLIKHQKHTYNKKGYTKMAEDWTVVLRYACSSREDALFLERFIKRMKSRKFIAKVIANPQILDDILDKK